MTRQLWTVSDRRRAASVGVFVAAIFPLAVAAVVAYPAPKGVPQVVSPPRSGGAPEPDRWTAHAIDGALTSHRVDASNGEVKGAAAGQGIPVNCPTGVGCQIPDQMGHGSSNFVWVTADVQGGNGFRVADNFRTDAPGTITSLC